MRMLVITLGCLSTLLLAAPGAYALSCPSRQTFDSKVSDNPVVLVGKLQRIVGKKYHVEVVKVLKGSKLVGARKAIVFDHGQPRMGSGFGFVPKPGQLIIFFLGEKANDWLCSPPTLIQ